MSEIKKVTFSKITYFIIFFHQEKLRPIIQPISSTFVPESILRSLPSSDDYEMIKLEEDAILSGFTPWFRGLDWSQYRIYKPKSVSSILAQV